MVVSIFNDVIGPVMRGPSSSHCAAALRIGRLARDLMSGSLTEVLVQFDQYGSLATTHATQGSDMGLFGGLLGWDADDDRLPRAAHFIREAGIETKIEIAEFRDLHPNTYRLELRNENTRHTLKAISTGGGMIEVIEVDGFPVSIGGDYDETLVFLPDGGQELASRLAEVCDVDEILVHQSADGEMVEIKAQRALDESTLSNVSSGLSLQRVCRLQPVLPVRSRRDMSVPFTTCEEVQRFDGGRQMPLWKLAVQYETARGQMSETDVLERMTSLVRILRRSLDEGLAGTDYPDRILGHQCGGFARQMESGRLLPAGALNRTILYVTAFMEVKSAMGVIIAAPTAGSCAALPGACLAVADELKVEERRVVEAMLAAGLIGVLFAHRTTFAAEEAGCQAECGSASAMTAAALVTLAGGSASHSLAAASMALQSTLGLICDPVASRVEVPCLGKNVLAATNALACANMALADYDPVIPLDEVIDAADRVGRSLPRELRCTALGGLAATKTSYTIAEQLVRKKDDVNE